MNIQDAIKETGKAYSDDMPSKWYLMKRKDGVPMWYGMASGDVVDEMRCATGKELLEFDWQPFNPVVEIRPTEAGELWIDESGALCIIAKKEVGIGRSWCSIGTTDNMLKINPIPYDMIHSLNGWELLYSPNPKVMERIKEDVERIVIEGVTWQEHYGASIPNTEDIDASILLNDLKNQPKVKSKLIIEIPK